MGRSSLSGIFVARRVARGPADAAARGRLHILFISSDGSDLPPRAAASLRRWARATTPGPLVSSLVPPSRPRLPSPVGEPAARVCGRERLFLFILSSCEPSFARPLRPPPRRALLPPCGRLRNALFASATCAAGVRFVRAIVAPPARAGVAGKRILEFVSSAFFPSVFLSVPRPPLLGPPVACGRLAGFLRVSQRPEAA